MTLPRLTFVGVATQDTIALVDRFPAPDERVLADKIVHTGGGPAATAAVTAARLGMPTAFIGGVGDDETGEQVLAGLRTEGVDVSGVTVARGQATATSVVVVTGATRAICNVPGPAAEIAAGSAAAEILDDAAWIHVDQVGWSAVELARKGGIGTRARLSVDGGNAIPGLRLDGVDLYVPTIAALAARYGNAPLQDLLDAALADGARTAVATGGDQGAVAASADGTHCAVPALTADVVSTLGAGDVYHGALLAAVARGYALRDALAYAAAAAAASCEGLSGREAVPGHPAVLARAGIDHE
ncbi:carbohydrate kinase family protein [Nonomuraea sp. NPDC049480]|uniref:carbohydrate kinase family protein n=1 Tax=Nonomuraea sp. NPDC049480 TaxID=3364353 RepID=UPI0037A9E00B